MEHVVRVFACGALVTLAIPGARAQRISPPATPAGQPAVTTVVEAPILPEPPAKEPKVTCNGDQLTISAENSTLGSVLAAVRACTGIQVDVPEGAISGSRTFQELGPGSERQVLNALLDGASFDYVILSSEANPQKVASVTLIARATEEVAGAAGGSVADRATTPARKAWIESRKNLHGAAGAPVPEDAQAGTEDAQSRPEAEGAPAAPAEQPAAATPAPAAAAAADQPPPATPDMGPVSASGTMASSPADTSGMNPAASSDKSTADRIAEMQQLFEQRKQLNQTQNPAQNPNPTPAPQQP